MRIAWLSPYLPAPATSGGRIRIDQLARSLSHHELHLFARLGGDDAPLDSLPKGSLDVWASVCAERESRAGFSMRTPALPRTFPPALHQKLLDADHSKPFDVLIAEHCYSLHGLPRLSRAPVILNEHNVESEYWLGEFRDTRKPNRLKEYLRWRAFERQCWRRADAVTAVSKRDARRIERFSSGSCQVISNGVTAGNYRYVPPSERTGNAILFVGMMSYQPNVVAARTLAREVLPRVQQHIPDATLTIAGRAPNPKVRALSNPSVRVTGTLANLAGLFDEHAVYANPIRFGGGSSLKTLEPLICGLPLAAGSFAVRGFSLEPGRHYLQADADDALAEQVLHALTNRSQLDTMAKQARLLATRYAWPTLTQPFAQLVEQHSHGRTSS